MILRTPHGPLRYRDEGPRTKEAVVFVHGLGADLSCFTKQLVHFRKDRRSVAFDLPNHGESFAFGNGMSYEAINEVLKDFLDGIGVERAVLVGLSMGGHIVQYFTHRHAEYVEGVVDVGSTPLHRPLRFRNYLKLRLVCAISRFVPIRILVRIIAGKDRGRTEKSQDYLINRIAERTGKKDMLKMLRTMVKAARKGISEPVEAPLLIVHGENDQQRLAAVARRWHEQTKDSTYAIIENAGHIANQDNAKAFNRVLASWLEETVDPPKSPAETEKR